MNEVIATVISKKTGLPTVFYRGKQPVTGATGAVPGPLAVPVDETGSLEMQRDQREKSLAERPQSAQALDVRAREKAKEMIKGIT